MKEPLQLYGLKNCDTCKKAMKALDGAGVEFLFHDIRDGSLKATQVSKWVSIVGSEVLVNRRSTTWRKLTDAERAQSNSKTQIVDLLLANPTLIKRPVIVSSNSVSAGWTTEVQARLGL